ncbi:diaminopimelate decarboxylase [Corynebacterium sp. CNJ-954]|nr:diaminopimelate decarboxylase [Corynebacterium sp. CNJ-954]
MEPWVVSLLSDSSRCRTLVEKHGSPVNVLRTAPMVRNMAELRDVGADAGVETRVFYARKANKALCFVDTAVRAGHGVDVASERELRQVLDRGVPGGRVILSAAVKPDRLLRLAVDHGVTVSVDSVVELDRLRDLGASDGSRRPRVAPRIAPDPSRLPPTRFGERLRVWEEALRDLSSSTGRLTDPVDVVGVHLHLHGYSASDRLVALEDALHLIDTAVDAGHRPEFVDLGGGVPMSYLDDEAQWNRFQSTRQAMADGAGGAFTWKSDPLANTYPFHQAPVRGGWLRELLDGRVGQQRQQETAALALTRRGLRLHLEPGRSVLDGCGVILARVAFLKDRSDGVPLVGVEMNRTQCRTTSDDILVDPILVRVSDDIAPERAPGSEGFLVGAYCIEDEVIIRRRLRFPEGISTGDIIAVPNTAGYFMHILESASHQIPLAVNVVLDADGTPKVDDIDTAVHGTAQSSPPPRL